MRAYETAELSYKAAAPEGDMVHVDLSTRTPGYGECGFYINHEKRGRYEKRNL